MITGIDASHWQGVLPIEHLKSAGIEFAILKAVHGASIDPDPAFRGNWARLSSSGILKSAYLWFTDADPVLQAENFVRIVERVEECDLPLAVDFEEPNTRFRGVELVDRLRACLRRLREVSGQSKLFLYSGKWYLDLFAKGVDLSDLVEENYYWHAEYPRLSGDLKACGLRQPKVDKPRLPKAWIDKGVAQTLWQYDGNGGCTLPNGVDADFNLFDGTLDDLRGLSQARGLADTLPAPPITYPETNVPNALDVVYEVVDQISKAKTS